MLKANLAVNNSIEDKPREKCGVIAVWCDKKFATYYVRKGLYSLQHRGQESAGISIYDEKAKIKTVNGMGLVPNVLTKEILQELGESKAAIGHNRYSTTGTSNSCNAQPITVKKGKFQISIGHNGNIPDVQYLNEAIVNKIEVEESSDTHLIAQLLLQEREKYSSWDDTLQNTLPKISGAFCFVILTEDGTIYGTRDPFAIRPFCLGKLENGWIIASESVAFDLNGAEFIRDIKPGEIIKISYNGQISSQFFGVPKRPQNCIFEYIYFSRPDSFENGIRVRTGREASGRLLGKRILRKGIKADAVVPVFDSGYPAAKGVAQAMGLPMIDAITVSHYIGRTFIQPGQANRLAAVNGKHNVVPDEIIGKKIIVVDDSVIRLTTSRQLTHSLKESGAKEVYVASASPPVIKYCDMGIDMKSNKELPASQWEHESFETIEKNVAQLIGADGMIYLPIDELAKAFGGVKQDFYHYPFGGPHPIRDPQAVFPKLTKSIKGNAKICILISGKGTFTQDIIDSIEKKDMNAEIVGIISNKKDAYGITRAKNHKIPFKIIEYTENLSDKDARKKYDRKLLEYIKSLSPDIVLLSGWQLILGDEFNKELQKMQIPVINHHPALLTDNNSDTVATSRGSIPVMRGSHVMQETFAKKLQVSGISVHQILPSDMYDVGPVILKAEVRIHPHDTYESWKKRMEETEHLILPTAIKRIIHVIKNGIDITKGDFYW